jgi:TolB-like protein/class 3 adenylate cyclase/rhodanese-related sulfurtransferase
MEHLVSENGVERRLTTILSADVVGYSRLVGQDEPGTVAALKNLRKELVEPKLAQYHGRMVKLMGDGALMEFGSVVDAVSFAVEVQTAMKDRNGEIPEDQQIAYRIGINIGDIIVEEDDIYGDGVNMASRLEGLAEPGGICASRTVINHVKGKIDLNFEDLGEQEVKNIAEPVRVYQVVVDDKAAAMVTPVVEIPVRVAPLRSWQFAVAAAVGLVVLGGLLWWQPWGPEFEPASVERMAVPLPENPSVAVLPFDNMSGDAEQEYFADGMTDDLITDLSKIPGLFVIARNSTFTYKGQPVKVQKVAEDLGVRYVLEGSVRRVGDEVRINAQLIDAISGHHVWADRYDSDFTNIFDLQDKIIQQIVSALAISIKSAEAAEFKSADTQIAPAYDAFLQGREHHRRQTAQDAGRAISFFERAIELDPGYARAYAGLAAVYWDVANLGWYWDLDIEWKFALDQANKYLATALEHPTKEALALSAEMLVLQGRSDEAIAQIDRAIALDPNAADSYVSKARVLNAMGLAGQAEEQAHLALRLNPLYSPGYLRALGRSLFHQERYEEAAEIMERVVSRQSDNPYDYATLAAIYGQLGRIEDAKAAVQKYNELYGKYEYTPMTVQEIGWWWYADLYDYETTYKVRLVEGLRKAGVPEGAAPQTPEFQFEHLLSKSDGIYQVDGATHIDVATAKEFADEGVVFIDVRDHGSFARGHIPGAHHLDLNLDFTQDNLSQLLGGDDPVVMYCWGPECTWSAYAAAKAVTWGFTRVYRFSGGFPAWKGAGHQVDVFKGY